ncbi:protein of unknown function DUF1788 [Bacteroides coprosuis DSM 18011]|uniref:Cytoplasmic protein n=1 Tax=Bacteroides coprosuis DSM 18011 TaxID=679937 RepID=F3ZRF3_9BACE|nr:DUF1788 domain-containing protein [Bacteroides coprosuis]EGJ71961.1 protein of unknown function DUF1788 [Bacteroides coprosuis DSM 18011]
MKTEINTVTDLFPIVSSERYLNMEALGGEIPFWIYPYDIQKEATVELEIKGLVQKLKVQNISVLCLDLFELSVSIIQEDVGLDEMFEIEQEMREDDKHDFLRATQSVLDIHNRFIPKIKELIDTGEYQILFLKGIGAVYPFIRSHIILNNLQSIVKEMPTLLFFPGEYTGQALNIFGKLKDDNYYRAFNILEYKL